MWKLLVFNRSDIFIYLLFGIGLIYIWKISNISSAYLLPFIIFIGFIYLRQDYFHKINIETNYKLEEIKKNILNNKYPFISSNPKMLIFLDSIHLYSKYNPQNYKDFIEICEKYFKTKDIYIYLKCIDRYDNLILSLPIQILKNHYLKKKELVHILKQILSEPKRKMVEMQSFIPYNAIDTKNKIFGEF